MYILIWSTFSLPLEYKHKQTSVDGENVVPIANVILFPTLYVRMIFCLYF